MAAAAASTRVFEKTPPLSILDGDDQKRLPQLQQQQQQQMVIHSNTHK